MGPYGGTLRGRSTHPKGRAAAHARAQTFATVRSLIVATTEGHGDGSLSLEYLCAGRPMQPARSFEAEPVLRANDLARPSAAPPPRVRRVGDGLPARGLRVAGQTRRASDAGREPCAGVFHQSAGRPGPEVHLLFQQGPLHVMITAAEGWAVFFCFFFLYQGRLGRDPRGGGWREDTTRDSWGSFIYLRRETLPRRPDLRRPESRRAQIRRRHVEAIFPQAPRRLPPATAAISRLLHRVSRIIPGRRNVELRRVPTSPTAGAREGRSRVTTYRPEGSCLAPAGPRDFARTTAFQPPCSCQTQLRQENPLRADLAAVASQRRRERAAVDAALLMRSTDRPGRDRRRPSRRSLEVPSVGSARTESPAAFDRAGKSSSSPTAKARVARRPHRSRSARRITLERRKKARVEIINRRRRDSRNFFAARRWSKSTTTIDCRNRVLGAGWSHSQSCLRHGPQKRRPGKPMAQNKTLTGRSNRTTSCTGRCGAARRGNHLGAQFIAAQSGLVGYSISAIA